MALRQDASTGQIVDDGRSKSATKTKSKLLSVKIHSPFKVYYDGEADSISAVNNTGPFDVLPGHHKFITLLNPCDLIVRAFNEEKRIRIARGIMHVKSDSVTIFLDV